MTGWVTAPVPTLCLDCQLQKDCCCGFGGISEVELDYSVLTMALGNTKKCNVVGYLTCIRQS